MLRYLSRPGDRGCEPAWGVRGGDRPGQWNDCESAAPLDHDGAWARDDDGFCHWNLPCRARVRATFDADADAGLGSGCPYRVELRVDVDQGQLAR